MYYDYESAHLFIFSWVDKLYVDIDTKHKIVYFFNCDKAYDKPLLELQAYLDEACLLYTATDICGRIAHNNK